MNLFDLSNKVAIVTGGNGGIGLGMARGLAKARATVVVAARNSKHLWLLVSTLLVLVQPADSAEENMRKVGIVSSFSVDAALRSPGYKRFTDAIRASAPHSQWQSGEGPRYSYPAAGSSARRYHNRMRDCLHGSVQAQ